MSQVMPIRITADTVIEERDDVESSQWAIESGPDGRALRIVCGRGMRDRVVEILMTGEVRFGELR